MELAALAPVIADNVRLHRVALTLTEPVQATHGLHEARNVILVQFNNGWGECGAPDDAGYTGETADAAAEALKTVLLPYLASLAQPVCAIELRRLLGDHSPDSLVRFPMAVAALEMAILDAQLRAANLAFSQCFSAPAKTCATAGATLGNTGSLDQLARRAAAAAEEGYSRLKIKIGPTLDVEVIRAVRGAVGNQITLLGDANGAYGDADVSHVASLHELGLDIVEQPFAAHDTRHHQKLVATGTLRVALDEGVRSADDALGAVLNHECTDLTLKPARFGYPACMRIFADAHEQGIDAWVGGMFDTGVARWANARLATHCGVTLASDIGASSRYWANDITPSLQVENGLVVDLDLSSVGLSGVPVV